MFVSLTLVAACSSSAGNSGGSAGACGPVRREPLDPRSLQHVLPNAPTPQYRTDPPTSGPHQPSPPVSGALATSLPKPVQVGLLEGGNVLVQYRGLPKAKVRVLDGMAGPKTVVAPNPELERGQVVLTSWLHKQTCSTVDPRAIRAFVTARAGRGADHPQG